MLQKRLIAKTEEVVEKGIVIQEKDKLYNELKAILARQPGPEVVECNFICFECMSISVSRFAPIYTHYALFIIALSLRSPSNSVPTSIH